MLRFAVHSVWQGSNLDDILFIMRVFMDHGQEDLTVTRRDTYVDCLLAFVIPRHNLFSIFCQITFFLFQCEKLLRHHDDLLGHQNMSV